MLRPRCLRGCKHVTGRPRQHGPGAGAGGIGRLELRGQHARPLLTSLTMLAHCVPLPAAGGPEIMTRSGWGASSVAAAACTFDGRGGRSVSGARDWGEQQPIQSIQQAREKAKQPSHTPTPARRFQGMRQLECRRTP